jgi:transcriptional regulator with XRE-family HTH domain
LREVRKSWLNDRVPTDPTTYGVMISRNVLAARARARLKQSEVAARMRALGYSWHPQTVGEIEKGNRRLTAEECMALAYALDTSMGVLLEPSSEEGRIVLPSGRTVDAASVAWSVRHFNDRSVTWNDDVPEFRDIPESRRTRDLQDAAIGPMARYGRYVPGHSLTEPSPLLRPHFANSGPTADDLDDWESAAAPARETKPGTAT